MHDSPSQQSAFGARDPVAEARKHAVDKGVARAELAATGIELFGDAGLMSPPMAGQFPAPALLAASLGQLLPV